MVTENRQFIFVISSLTLIVFFYSFQSLKKKLYQKNDDKIIFIKKLKQKPKQKLKKKLKNLKTKIKKNYRN